MTYTAIGFDYGGVMAATDAPPFGEVLSQHFGLSRELFREAYFHHNGALGRGEIDYAECWRRAASELGLTDRLPEILELLGEWRKHEMRLVPTMVELVDGLRGQGYKVGLLSNNSLEAGARLRADGLDHHFDAFLISAEIGHAKPEPAAFEELSRQLGVPLPELAFIDDTDRSLSTAETVGYRPIRFTSYEELVNQLRELGIELKVTKETDLPIPGEMGFRQFA